MSTKPETLFYKQIFRELKQVFWTRIENRHGGGIPDLYGVTVVFLSGYSVKQ